jgi:transporter family-2 protein
VIALGEGVPSLRVMAGVPWWAWSGGLFGGAFILLIF